MIRCRVCNSGEAFAFQTVAKCDYWRCTLCQATFIDAKHLPDEETERKRYTLHENDPNDAGYRHFLSKLANPLLKRLPQSQQGLDFGCGTGPALAHMLTEAGHSVRLYDPFFHPDTSALARTYDFITCTETAEHFHRPAEEFARLNTLLRPGGILAIMTCFQTDDSRFADWHYRRDETHVVFYREETFRHLAAQFAWQCEIPVKDVALMFKSA